MPDIRHRVGITAPSHRVYEALATNEGLTDFWTTMWKATARWVPG